MGKLVSVVTVFHNRARHVAASVGSLLAQTHRELEIIVVDDGSTDDTSAELAKLRDPRLDVRVQANVGFTVAVDRAARSARGEVIAIHGSGDFSSPTRVERQLAALEANPKLAVVGCLVMDNAGVVRAPSGMLQVGQPMGFHDLLSTYPMTHGEAMFRKPLFEKVGGYRHFFQLAQDFDLWLRMAEHGHFMTVPEALYQRRQFDNSINTSIIKLMLQSHYGDFAAYCARVREAEGYDPLDRFGYAAALMAPKSKSLSRKLSSMGVTALLRGDQNGQLLIAAGYAARRNPRSVAALTFSWLQKQRFFSAIMDSK
ncbi:glycosyltransferase family 2 protein [Sphingomonas lenta]|nr:glycosyltransferase family 2 protein [Sphingomonas lenta]